MCKGENGLHVGEPNHRTPRWHPTSLVTEIVNPCEATMQEVLVPEKHFFLSKGKVLIRSCKNDVNPGRGARGEKCKALLPEAVPVRIFRYSEAW